MAYNDDKTWLDLTKEAQLTSAPLVRSLYDALKGYDEWQSFRASRTDAQIATAVSRTEAEVAELDSHWAACLALYNYADNQSPTQSDYFFSLRKFT